MPKTTINFTSAGKVKKVPKIGIFGSPAQILAEISKSGLHTPISSLKLSRKSSNVNSTKPDLTWLMQIMEVIPRKSANVRESLQQDYPRIFEEIGDLFGQQKVRESVADFCGLSRTV